METSVEIREAEEGGGEVCWWARVEKMNKSSLERMGDARVEVSHGYDDPERRFGLMAWLSSGGGTEEHGWSGDTAAKGVNTPKQ
ncbi:hypothetical protein SLA2020_288930 [Shorea laevis]